MIPGVWSWGPRTEPRVFPRHSFPHSPNPSLPQTPGSSSLATPYMLSLSILHLQERCPTHYKLWTASGKSSYQLLVQVQDAGSPPRSTTGTVHIAVLDLNDNSPTFLQASRGLLVESLPIQVCEAAGPCLEVRECGCLLRNCR